MNNFEETWIYNHIGNQHVSSHNKVQFNKFSRYAYLQEQWWEIMYNTA